MPGAAAIARKKERRRQNRAAINHQCEVAGPEVELGGKGEAEKKNSLPRETEKTARPAGTNAGKRFNVTGH